MNGTTVFSLPNFKEKQIEKPIYFDIGYCTASFAKLGKMDEAYDAFEETVRVIERIILMYIAKVSLR